jgi:ferredoxin-type protein NapG
MDAESKDNRAPKEEATVAGMTRRTFTLGVGGAVALLAVGGLSVVPAQAQVRPPGGQDEDHLQSACIRCQRCVEACPRNALTPTTIEKGILGTRMPTVNFSAGWCDFCEEEYDGVPHCVECCPTEALRLSADATAETTIIGKAVLIKDWCLAWSKYNGCRFCYDACPYEAIELDSNKRPVLVQDKCNGCGACENACVSLQEGSIAEGATSRAIIVVTEDRVSEYEA